LAQRGRGPAATTAHRAVIDYALIIETDTSINAIEFSEYSNGVPRFIGFPASEFTKSNYSYNDMEL